MVKKLLAMIAVTLLLGGMTHSFLQDLGLQSYTLREVHLGYSGYRPLWEVQDLSCLVLPLVVEGPLNDFRLTVLRITAVIYHVSHRGLL